MPNSCFHKQVISAHSYQLSQSAEGWHAASHLNHNHSPPKEFLVTVQSLYHSSLNTATILWGMKAERRGDKTLGLRNAGQLVAAGIKHLIACTQLCCCYPTVSVTAFMTHQHIHHVHRRAMEKPNASYRSHNEAALDINAAVCMGLGCSHR